MTLHILFTEDTRLRSFRFLKKNKNLSFNKKLYFNTYNDFKVAIYFNHLDIMTKATIIKSL